MAKPELAEKEEKEAEVQPPAQVPSASNDQESKNEPMVPNPTDSEQKSESHEKEQVQEQEEEELEEEQIELEDSTPTAPDTVTKPVSLAVDLLLIDSLFNVSAASLPNKNESSTKKNSLKLVQDFSLLVENVAKLASAEQQCHPAVFYVNEMSQLLESTALLLLNIAVQDVDDASSLLITPPLLELTSKLLQGSLKMSTQLLRGKMKRTRKMERFRKRRKKTDLNNKKEAMIEMNTEKSNTSTLPSAGAAEFENVEIDAQYLERFELARDATEAAFAAIRSRDRLIALQNIKPKVVKKRRRKKTKTAEISFTLETETLPSEPPKPAWVSCLAQRKQVLVSRMCTLTERVVSGFLPMHYPVSIYASGDVFDPLNNSPKSVCVWLEMNIFDSIRESANRSLSIRRFFNVLKRGTEESRRRMKEKSENFNTVSDAVVWAYRKSVESIHFTKEKKTLVELELSYFKAWAKHITWKQARRGNFKAGTGAKVMMTAFERLPLFGYELASRIAGHKLSGIEFHYVTKFDLEKSLLPKSKVKKYFLWNREKPDVFKNLYASYFHEEFLEDTVKEEEKGLNEKK
eukprot:g886.t1